MLWWQPWQSQYMHGGSGSGGSGHGRHVVWSTHGGGGGGG